MIEDLTRRNRMLAALPTQAVTLLLPHLRSISLRRGDVLNEQPEAGARVLFPLTGAVGLFAVLSDGREVGSSVVGNEGMLGLGLLGGRPPPWRSLVISEGEALALDAAALRRYGQRDPEVIEVFTRYAVAAKGVSDLAIGCLAFHPIVDRLARWLLLIHDRSTVPELELPESLLATLLGTTVPTVRRSLRVLRDAGGLTGLTADRVGNLNREVLEQMSCPCYRNIRALLENP